MTLILGHHCNLTSIRFQAPVETEDSGGGLQLLECFPCTSNQQLVNRTCIDMGTPTEETPTEEAPPDETKNLWALCAVELVLRDMFYWVFVATSGPCIMQPVATHTHMHTHTHKTHTWMQTHDCRNSCRWDCSGDCSGWSHYSHGLHLHSSIHTPKGSESLQIE